MEIVQVGSITRDALARSLGQIRYQNLAKAVWPALNWLTVGGSIYTLLYFYNVTRKIVDLWRYSALEHVLFTHVTWVN